MTELEILIEDDEEAKTLIPLSDEQYAAIDAMVAKRLREDKERREDERTIQRHAFFNTAEKWAEKPDLNGDERCHGVAHDLYRRFGTTHMVHPDTQMPVVGSKELGEDYGRLYDNIKASNIQAKLMRSAADLFD